MEILSFGGGRRMRECQGLLESLTAELSGRLILLPIPTTRDNIYVKDTDMPLSGILPLLGKGDLLVGYNIPKSIFLGAENLGCAVYDAGRDERFLYENALISAKGALGYVLTNFPKDVSDLKIGIIGYGRIGRELLRCLICLGSRPILYTGRREVAMELGKDGVDCRVISDDPDPSGLDLLINTSPALEINIDRLDEKTSVIDLASGNVFPPDPRLVKLASIPDVYYPLTAGRLYAEGVLRFLDMEVSL